MSESKSPPRPNLENRKKQAKTLLKALRDGDPSAAERLRHNLPRLHRMAPTAILLERVTLQEAQHVVARECGYHGWTAMVHALTSGSALGIFETLGAQELIWIAERAEAEELAIALKAVSARVRARLRAACPAEVWSSVEVRTAQIGPVRLSDVERTQMELVQRLPKEDIFV